MQGIFLCVLPFLTTCSTAHFYELMCLVNMWSSLKCYPPSSHQFTFLWYKLLQPHKMGGMERAESSSTLEGWKWLEMTHLIGKPPCQPSFGDGNLQIGGQDRQPHVGMLCSAPATVGKPPCQPSYGDGNLQIGEQDRQPHVGMTCSAPATVGGPQDKQKTGNWHWNQQKPFI